MSNLHFVGMGTSDSGLTKKVGVLSRASESLGGIHWYAPWRRYVFFPNPGTLFDAICMREIADYCQALMAERT